VTTTTPATLRLYLLGQLAEEEADRLEERYFQDDSLWEEMLRAEEDLLEDYQDGRLDPATRAQLEARWLSAPDGRRTLDVLTRLRAAGAAARPAAPRPARRAAVRPRLGWVAGLAAAACIAWLVGGDMLRRQELLALRENAARLTEENERLRRESATRETPAAPADVASFTLSGGGTRAGGETPLLRLAPDALALRLILPVIWDATGLARYRVSIQAVGGPIVFSQSATMRDRDRLEVVVDARLLAPDDYLVTVEAGSASAREVVSSTYFRVAAGRPSP
jgi:hypothetical protein